MFRDAEPDRHAGPGHREQIEYAHRRIRRDIHPLRNIPDAWTFLRSSVRPEMDFAPVRKFAEKRSEESALPAAVWSDDRGELAAVKVQIDSVKRADCAVIDGESPDDRTASSAGSAVDLD